MGRFLTRRLLAAVLLLLGITMVTFVLTNVVPGDPAAANLGQRAIDDPEAVAAFYRRYGLDKPLPVQYFAYLRNLAHGDLGDSQQSRRPVREDLAEYAPATFELAGTAIAISMVIGVGFGTLAAFRRDRPVDWILRVVSILGVSIPVFWLVAHGAVRLDVPLAGVSRFRSPSSRRHPSRPCDRHVHRRRPARR